MLRERSLSHSASLMLASPPSLVAAGITKILLIVQEDVAQTLRRRLRNSCLLKPDEDRPVFSVDTPAFNVLCFDV